MCVCVGGWGGGGVTPVICQVYDRPPSLNKDIWLTQFLMVVPVSEIPVSCS